MKDMKRDQFIEEKMNAYIGGAEEAHVDLSAAEDALGERSRRRRARRRGLIALVSACASLLLIAIVLIGILPSLGGSGRAPAGDSAGSEAAPPSAQEPSGGEGEAGDTGEDEPKVIRFALGDALQRAAGLNELTETYGKKLEKLTDFSFASGVSVDYTLYYVEEEAALLKTDLLYSQDGRRVSVSLYTDLSGGRYRAEELDKFDALPDKMGRYTYEKTFVNGEYVCLGAFSYLGQACCAEVQSSNESAFWDLMEYLT